jgi:diguanylate cyclase (GGDEF)-like protein
MVEESKNFSEKFADKTNSIVTLFTTVIGVATFVSAGSYKNLLNKELNYLPVIFISISYLSFYLIVGNRHERKVKKLIEKLKYEEEDNRKNKLLLENSKRLIYDINIERHTDVITGIPNQAMFKEDVERITESIRQGELYQIILIDIDNFGSINKEYGYFKGDELIRSIARELYYSMRRNETIYKNKFISNEEPLTDNVYRKYNGGDEFIIIIKGVQDEAVGFLTRLHRQLKNFSEKTTEIIPKKFEIEFHAGIAPLFANDKADLALARVEECFRIAKRKESPLRVKWFKEVPINENTSPLYLNAVKEFTKTL